MAKTDGAMTTPASKLTVKVDLCTGCLACTLACSFTKHSVFNPELARIRVLKFEDGGVDAPLVCQQCDTPRCVEACPIGALVRDPANGILVVDEAVCDGCGICLVACPYGAIGAYAADTARGKRILKCDLCGGDPACVPWCETGALAMVPAEDEAVDRSMEQMVMAKQRFEIEQHIPLYRYFDATRRDKAAGAGGGR